VTVPVQDDEAPRLAEIGRRISEVGQNLSDFRSEVRVSFAEMVRRETYVAERDALKERIVALEQRAKSMQSLFYGSLASVVVAIVLMWITKGNG
jgi:hypothetical protein